MEVEVEGERGGVGKGQRLAGSFRIRPRPCTGIVIELVSWANMVASLCTDS